MLIRKPCIHRRVFFSRGFLYLSRKWRRLCLIRKVGLCPVFNIYTMIYISLYAVCVGLNDTNESITEGNNIIKRADSILFNFSDWTDFVIE